MNLAAPLIALALFAAGAARANDVGPPVGTRAPALSVTTPGGAAATLRDLAGPKGVVLVFYRSARWCPYCQAQLLSLRDAPDALARRGYKLAAISYDAPDVLARFTAQRDINYPLLSDAGSRTIDAFGLRDPQYKPGSLAYGVPQPAIFIVSRDGLIRAKLAEEGYKTRPPLEAVLASIDRLGPR
mgnify:CR=1 FL=1